MTLDERCEVAMARDGAPERPFPCRLLFLGVFSLFVVYFAISFAVDRASGRMPRHAPQASSVDF